jgi:outer membrane protein TolC
MKQFIQTLCIVLLGTCSSFAQSAALSLEECVAIALKNNTTLITTRNDALSAKKDVLSSYGGILPTIDASARSGRYKAGESTDMRDYPIGVDADSNLIFERRLVVQPGFSVNSHSAGLSINQNIFDGGEWWNAIGYAQSQKSLADFNLTSVTNTIIMNVQQAYFDLYRQQKLMEVYDLAVKRSQDQLDKTQKMFELGAVAKVDVFRSKVNLGNDKIQYLAQQNLVITAKNNLNMVMGRQPGEALEIVPEISLSPGYKNVDELYEQALENNPELKMYKQDVRSKELMVARSKSPMWPRLGAGFSYNRSNEDFDRVYSDYDRNWSYSVGLSLSMNLFNGFRDMVNIQKSRLALKNSMENYEYNRKNLIAAVMQYTDNYNSYLDIIKINEENLEAAKEEYRLAEERYRIGSGTQLEVREAQVNLTRAEQTLVAAKYYARVTQAQIEQALGKIQENVQETN